jgi:hypothetical protein
MIVADEALRIDVLPELRTHGTIDPRVGPARLAGTERRRTQRIERGGRDRIRRRVADAPRALPTLSCRFIYLDRVGGAGEHQERATGGMRKLLGGASMDQASDRAIAARAYDQQIERCAVQR